MFSKRDGNGNSSKSAEFIGGNVLWMYYTRRLLIPWIEQMDEGETISLEYISLGTLSSLAWYEMDRKIPWYVLFHFNCFRIIRFDSIELDGLAVSK